MGNRLGRRRDESEDSSDEEDKGTENVDKGGPDTWTIPVGATIALNDDSDVTDIAWHPEEEGLLAVGSDSNFSSGTRCLHIWDVKNGNDVVKPETSSTSELCWSHKFLATSCHTDVRVFSSGGLLVTELVGHECDIFTLVFSPSGQFLLTGGQDGFCRLWDSEDGWRCTQKWEHARWMVDKGPNPGFKIGGTWIQIAIWKDDLEFFAGTDDAAIHHFRVGEEAPLRTFLGHSSGITCLAWNQQKNILASGSCDQNIRLWSVVSDWQKALPIQGPGGEVYKDFGGWVTGLTWSPKDSDLLASWDTSYTARLWQADTGVLLYRVSRGRDNFSLDSSMNCITFSPDGNFLTSRGREVCIWKADSGEIVAQYERWHGGMEP